MKIRVAVLAVSCVLLAGCFDVPPKSSKITATYVPISKYAQYSCGQLVAELNDLVRGESQLATAEDQRHHTGKVQAFWISYGGRPNRAVEDQLAEVRGEKEAVKKILEAKQCSTDPTQQDPVSLPSQQSVIQPENTPAQQQPVTSQPQSNWRNWSGARGN